MLPCCVCNAYGPYLDLNNELLMGSLSNKLVHRKRSLRRILDERLTRVLEIRIVLLRDWKLYRAT